jgi:glutaredoxin
MKTYLFTTTVCPNCLPAKDYIIENEIDCEILYCDKDNNAMAMAERFGIEHVPTFVTLEDNGISQTFTFEEYKKEVVK